MHSAREVSTAAEATSGKSASMSATEASVTAETGMSATVATAAALCPERYGEGESERRDEQQATHDDPIIRLFGNDVVSRICGRKTRSVTPPSSAGVSPAVAGTSRPRANRINQNHTVLKQIADQ